MAIDEVRVEVKLNENIFFIDDDDIEETNVREAI